MILLPTLSMIMKLQNCVRTRAEKIILDFKKLHFEGSRVNDKLLSWSLMFLWLPYEAWTTHLGSRTLLKITRLCLSVVA